MKSSQSSWKDLFALKLIDSVGFSLKFDRFVRSISRGQKGFKFLLMGTCGSFDPNKKVGDAFHCTRAVNFNRGVLTQSGFTIRKDKVVIAECGSTSSVGLTELSANFLCLFTPELCKSTFASLDHSKIIAMESFDFFEVCQLNSLVCWGAIRVVSNLVEGTNAKFDRLLCSFESGCTLFLRLLIAENDFLKEHGTPLQLLSLDDLGTLAESNILDTAVRVRNCKVFADPLVRKVMLTELQSSIRAAFEVFIQKEERTFLTDGTKEQFNQWTSKEAEMRKRIEAYLTRDPNLEICKFVDAVQGKQERDEYFQNLQLYEKYKLAKKGDYAKAERQPFLQPLSAFAYHDGAPRDLLNKNPVFNAEPGADSSALSNHGPLGLLASRPQ